MNPIYKFQLTAGEYSQRAYPLYKDDLAIDYALEQNEQFYRGKLSGKLTFQQSDYTFIKTKAFDTKFDVLISISYDAGASWNEYWRGMFWKTDCEFNDDEQTVVVSPTLNDKYNNVISGLDKEYNLIDLAPEIVRVKVDKRSMIQVYVPGQNVIGCFLSGMWWEQECDAVTSESELKQIGDGKLNFAFNKYAVILGISGSMTPELPDCALAESTNETFDPYFDVHGGGYYFFAYRDSTDPENEFDVWGISDGTNVLWRATSYAVMPSTPYTVQLSPVPGSGATGTVTLNVSRVPVYARRITNVESASGVNTYEIGPDDMVADNRNYKRVVGYVAPDTITFTTLLSNTPTKWGIYQPGKYYDEPVSLGVNELFPVARAAWSRVSIWFAFSAVDWYTEERWRKEYTLNDAYPLWSVISVLLGQVAPGITHIGTTDYSRFLYGTNPITSIVQRLCITPKSNLITSDYDQPAQKAMITLRNVLDMLRDCFRCYWFIDSDDKFCIEHISYFMNGGAYPGTPDYPKIGINLTEQIVTRNGKPWAFVQNKYQYDKPEMAARYQFGWMDDVTELFNGFPIDIISGYVNPDNVENIDVSKFTSDVDYILLNPSEISKDGFVLLAPTIQSGALKLPYFDFVINGTSHVLQNAYVSFMYLQRYYAYDMPARRYSINGEAMVAVGVKKGKTQSNVKFPVYTEPDLTKLIKTELGNGTLQKLSVNLSSRNANATLKYDTE